MILILYVERTLKDSLPQIKKKGTVSLKEILLRFIHLGLRGKVAIVGLGGNKNENEVLQSDHLIG